METRNPALKREHYAHTQARHLTVTGRVQGVGFRPFIYQLAKQYNLCGHVQNRIGVVEIHIEGQPDNLDAFEKNIIVKAPSLAQPCLQKTSVVTPGFINTFTISESSHEGDIDIHVSPDQYTCDDCLHELNDPTNRRYRYPFINCTQCGPRYTLIKDMPYDRKNTSMSEFKLCKACSDEYTDPENRRFHAEPIACNACGPELEYHSENILVRDSESALQHCISTLRKGLIVAVKGIGGYHLMCDAYNNDAVKKLRETKQRPDKPLAVLFPSPVNNPLEHVAANVILSQAEIRSLTSPARPIILARKKGNCKLSQHLAPGLNEIGAMLPYSPLHHLLLNDFDSPLVATSANVSGEPVLTDNNDVEKRLAHVANAFLHHNRPIVRPADDAVYRTINKKLRLLRPGRGTAPIELKLPVKLDKPVIAVGGHMKSTIALAWHDRVVISPHIGDMGTKRSLEVFNHTIHDLQQLHNITAEAVVCDAHPDYATTHWANNCGLPVYPVFHHHAHASTVFDVDIFNNETSLVFTWDGVGYGEDETLWGGEALIGQRGRWQRYASMKPFLLAGGENAAKHPWYSAASLCWETEQAWNPPIENISLLEHAWLKKLNTNTTTSVGRLFDAAAALTGTCLHASFEGQGPMQLEATCEGEAAIELPLEKNNGLWLTNWSNLVPILLDMERSVSDRAACFHNSLAYALLQQANQAKKEHNIKQIGLSGGVFQNRVLTDFAVTLLENNGFNVFTPSTIPMNDAGLCFGQIIEFAYKQPENNSTFT